MIVTVHCGCGRYLRMDIKVGANILKAAEAHGWIIKNSVPLMMCNFCKGEMDEKRDAVGPVGSG
jgi:hypothetical protein